ncbi:MAG: cellulase family glycosylhydrolase [Candidatus Eisenbacteria sp.]|nr:cellulase family glycosylhydrolase [Candidatus Eisenbacteria bacterium]
MGRCTTHFSRRKHGGGAALLTVLSVVLLLTLIAPSPGRATGFVEVEGTGLVLDGCPFEFVGTNCYYLMVYGADPGLRHYSAEVLDEAAMMNCTVLRTWAFNDGAGQWNALQTAPGVYDETVFQALDWVIAKADSVGLKLVLPLINNWDDYGGMNQYIEWARTSPPLPTDAFVTVSGTHFELDGSSYYYTGTNFWYGLNLASTGAGGDRERLDRELDQLWSNGISNLRIMAGSEGPDTEPWRMVPSLQTSPGVYDAQVLDGLDYLLWAMGERGMKAIMCLNNFWPWSGGMAQYVSWNGGGAIPYPPPEPGGDWNLYQEYAASFYSNSGAMQDFRDHISFIANRENTYTGESYKDDPTIMAWELGNEPRGFHTNAANFNIWIDATAAYIKSLDTNHLVTTGCEGDTPWPSWNGLDFDANHDGPDIDYTTIHIWPQNWGWYDPGNPSGYALAESNARSYFNNHEAQAQTLGKPMVLEEFGLARDGGSYDPAASTQYRDQFYAAMFDEILTSAAGNGPAGGDNFWAWAGEGRPLEPYGSFWNPGDPWIGDPPHEHQGWYSVYDSDTTTLAVLAAHGADMYALMSGAPTQHDDFYTHATCRQMYKDHVSAVLNRINTITGIAYKDDPTILAWELANETRCQSDPTCSTLQTWIEEMAPYYKSIDANHLLTTGQEGFFNYGSGPWYQNGSQGTDFIANHQVADIDFCTFHLWPNNWGNWTHSQSMTWVNDHITAAHGAVGKPVFIGEFGLYREGGGTTIARDQLFESIFEAFRTQSGAGALFWILYHDAYPDYDGYGVYYPADESTITIIMDAAEALIDTTPPDNVTSFQAVTRDQVEGFIDLSWTEPDNIRGVRIYRQGVGGYPLYDDGGGVVPAWPATEDEAIAGGWLLIAELSPGTTTLADGPLTRDMYYYAAFTIGCNWLPALGDPGARDRALSYHLGDFDENGGVGFYDLNTFSGTFLTATGEPGFLPETDIGPTDDQTKHGLPLTDGYIGFEDLMIFALSFDGGSDLLRTGGGVGKTGAVRVWIEDANPMAPGLTQVIRLSLGNIWLQGIHARIHWQGDTPPEVRPGEDWSNGGWFHAARPESGVLELSAVRLGPRALAGGEHVLAVLVFPEGQAPGAITIESVIARSPRNRPLAVELGPGSPDPQPAALSLQIRPNPSRGLVSFMVEAPAAAVGAVYDPLGRKLRSLGPWVLPDGRGIFVWDRTDDGGRPLPEGVYLFEVRSGQDRVARKIHVIR